MGISQVQYEKYMRIQTCVHVCVCAFSLQMLGVHRALQALVEGQCHEGWAHAAAEALPADALSAEPRTVGKWLAALR